MRSKYIVFDLDDTLAYEMDYLRSAYREIAGKLGNEELYAKMIDMYGRGENVFEYLANNYNTTLPELLDLYRNHYPDIELIDGAAEVLKFCIDKGYQLGLISDGRSVTQRNKLKALEIEQLFDSIVISEEFGSEKPTMPNYQHFMSDEINTYFYIADNTKKDFITPNKLGWVSVCLLDKGENIHPQSFDVPELNQPKYKIDSLLELSDIIEQY